MAELKHPYICVERNGERSYGGSQGWSSRSLVQKCGCGVIAGTDLLLYLHQNRPGCDTPVFCAAPNGGAVEQRDYEVCADKLCRGYFPLIPYFGLNNLVLTVGLNRYFWKYRLELRARWGVRPSRLWEAVRTMLETDIPVILAIGANFPFVWQNHQVRFYLRAADGSYRSTYTVKAHYVAVTGWDGEWLQVSSWGGKYYINCKEYEEYVKKHSCCLLSNIVYVRSRT